MEPFDEHLKRLRKAFVGATPRQRLGVALDRVKNPGCGPNRLIQIVSAVEGLARAVVMNEAAAQDSSVDEVYADVRNANASELVKRCLGGNPAARLGGDTWETFQNAAQYRNLLIHECTFLREGYSERLIGAAAEVFGVLAEMADT